MTFLWFFMHFVVFYWKIMYVHEVYEVLFGDMLNIVNLDCLLHHILALSFFSL